MNKPQASEFLHVSINSLTYMIIFFMYNNNIDRMLIITYILKNLLIEIQRSMMEINL